MDGVVEKEKGKLIQQLGSVSQFGITTDLWTHDQSSHSYITVTCQYIESFSIHSQILATRVLDSKHNAENIRDNVKSVLEEFSAMRPSNVFVTDNASNMKAAFREFSWVGCACHNMNLVLAHAFSKKACSAGTGEAEDSGMPTEVVDLIDNCKEIVTLAKRTHVNTMLESTLKQCVVTRWNSVLTTLKSVRTNLDQLRSLTSTVGINRNLLRMIVDLNDTLLGELVDILEPFDTATKCLSTDKEPTLHLVIPTKVQLSKHLSPAPADSAVIIQVKQHLHNQLEVYFKTSPIHAVATLLDHRLKNNFAILPPQQHAAALVSLKQMVEAVTGGLTESTSDAPPVNKKLRLQDNFFGDLYATPSTSDANEVIISNVLCTALVFVWFGHYVHTETVVIN